MWSLDYGHLVKASHLCTYIVLLKDMDQDSDYVQLSMVVNFSSGFKYVLVVQSPV